MILACADGLTSADVARRNDTSPNAIAKWHRRFLALGVQGLYQQRHRAASTVGPWSEEGRTRDGGNSAVLP